MLFIYNMNSDELDVLIESSYKIQNIIDDSSKMLDNVSANANANANASANANANNSFNLEYNGKTITLNELLDEFHVKAIESIKMTGKNIFGELLKTL